MIASGIAAHEGLVAATKWYWFIPPIAYLLGSIPFGYLIVKRREGHDIRSQGSGNIGAANVTRVAGLGAGAMTFLLDVAKGYLSVWGVARLTDENITWMMVAALAAIAGHLFPVWLGFRGGRGVATGVGVFLPVCLPAVLLALLIWMGVALFWRYASLASIVASASLPPLTYLLYAPGHAPPRIVSFSVALAAVLIILRHRANIERLIAGTEARMNFRR